MKNSKLSLLGKALFVVCVFSFLAHSNAHAAFKGTIEFTDAEKFLAYQVAEKSAKASAKCLRETFKYHGKFFNKYKISPFYGNNGPWQHMDMIDRVEFFEKRRISLSIMDLLRPISCVGFATQCTGEGFLKTGQDTAWAKIMRFMEENDQDGLALQHALHQLGWSVLYWTPEVSKAIDYDKDEQASDSENKKHYWGYHEYRWETINTKGMYLDNQVDDYTLLVDFKDRTPKALKKTPFFVGTAHGGYHVFSGGEGKITEAHSMRALDDKSNIEVSDFNPLKRGGAPTGRYRSGLIAFPPGYLEEIRNHR